ncbi:phenylalanine--tRNA ligase subunit beta [Schaalia sp. lx-100]|uniref:phenylalanine--tRNA ligase subunit beta n=1 Tax=Schaalia sp. lx-100 TaxID=2899081 RepID=UPI001E3C5EA1|nr:phenylalanine--tRNA ligase subunit beta [Schaalia sp. lx-100]MCD4557429.1 phenylalanine--tRNA ligase subunit beta [Schaalia sp. lx-100]
MPMVPLSWLADHVDVPSDIRAEALAEALVKVGLEEETIHPAKVIGPLVVGRVLSLVKETASNGKTVNYCRVDVGVHNDPPGTGKEPCDFPSRGIICGAHNFVEGDRVVVSLPGAVLPGDFAIAARKTYGHISDGMICSARELGLGDEHDGIIVLDREYPDRQIPAVGEDLISFLGLGEEVLEINVTPDRGYCFSMRGVAREFSHATGHAFRDPGLSGVLVSGVPEATEDGFPVLVEDQAPIKGNVGCDRFVTRIVRGINPSAPTPRWMVERLEAAGMRSLSLAVDITNYIMLDLGQPMHAYDLDALQGPVVVRRARSGESLVTLDEVERHLHEEDLLITDSPEAAGSRIIGLAGVMGGRYSEVEATTTNILLEAAHFDAVSVARTSRRHRVVSEASKRFERGVDPLLPAVAAQRAVDLLVEYGGGSADRAVSDFNALPEPLVISFPYTEAERLTGVAYTPERIRDLCEMIGCTVKETEGAFDVTVPSWRPDLVGPAHLVEEIARLDGYDAIPSILPKAPSGHGLTETQKARRMVAHTLAEAGLVEVKSYPFVSDSFDRQRIKDNDERRRALRLRNPLADDAPWLRTSIIDTLLESAGRNISRGMDGVAVYEIGMVARPAGCVPAPLLEASTRPSDAHINALYAGTPAQPWHVGIVCAGKTGSPLGGQRVVDWNDAVDMVRRVASILGVRVEVCRAWLCEPVTFKGAPMPQAATDPEDVAPWHPGRVARVFVRRGRDLVDVAYAGELHPGVCEAFGLPKRSIAVELDMDALIASRADGPIQVKPVSTYPVAKEDFAFVLPVDVPASRVEQAVRQGAGALAEDVTLFDIYEGESVGSGYRSLAFAVRLRGDHTLSAQEISSVREAIVQRVTKQLGGRLRS